MLIFARIFVHFSCLLVAGSALGHGAGENYAFINIHEKQINGHFEINLENLRNDLNLDISKTDTLTSVRTTSGIVQTHILENYSISANGTNIEIIFDNVELLGEGRAGFAQYYFSANVDPMPDELVFEDTLFYDNNKRHRGLLLVEYNQKTGKNYGPENTVLIFSPENPSQVLNLTDVPRLLKRPEFIWQGVIHILYGYDHILFLIALLLPTVLNRKESVWRSETHFRTVLLNFVKIVTLFTIAHSVSLTLAALGYIKFNAALIESIIALSIILIAINNIFPKYNDRTWILILFFGLFHGLGFANVMGQLPFRMVDLAYVMLFFNLGVELGQLGIVIILLPLLFFISRNVNVYVPVVLKGGSIVIGMIATVWLVERAF